jgi:hypothetical protein
MGYRCPREVGVGIGLRDRVAGHFGQLGTCNQVHKACCLKESCSNSLLGKGIDLRWLLKCDTPFQQYS